MPKVMKSERQVKYPKVQLVYHATDKELPNRKPPIVADLAKEWLGWQEQPEGVDWGEDFWLKDEYGKKIRLTNNSNNRPLRLSGTKALAQDILQKNWRLNHETIIIGRTGIVESAQHRLIALILAAQMWKIKNNHWIENWPTEPVIESLVVFGASEEPDIIRTLDNVIPRTLSDVVMTSGLFGEKVNKSTSERLARMMDYAVRMLWLRTGVKKDAFTPQQTHSESMEFITRHKRVVDCVRHIDQENRTKNENKKAKGKAKEKHSALSRYLPLGYAAGLLYLMGASSSDGDEYRNHASADERGESKGISWEDWDRARQFWVELAKGAHHLQAVKNAKRVVEGGTLEAPTTTYVFREGEGSGSLNEKIAVLARAWALYRKHKPIKPEDVDLAVDSYELEYADDKTIDSAVLKDVADFEGIDLPEEARVAASEAAGGEEVEAEKDKVRKGKIEKIMGNRAKSKAGEEKSNGISLLQYLKSVREDNPEASLLFRTEKGGYSVYEEDARVIAKAMKLHAGTEDGVTVFNFSGSALGLVVKQLASLKPDKPVKLVEKLADGQLKVMDAPAAPTKVKTKTK